MARAFVIILLSLPASAGTLLPNGEQQFIDQNGAPYAGGQVYFYFPYTLTPKVTWADPAQTIPNANPVVLDSAGRAIIYGVGSYRQQLFDVNNNLIWDQLTADTSANNITYWAGLAGGTPNAINLSDPNFNTTDGAVINFTALSTNTGATTLTPLGYGTYPVEKDTTSGPVALTGGEIVAGNPISVIFRMSDNAFHLLNTVIQSASGANSPLCGITHLVMNNDGTTPSTVIDITADQAVTQSNARLVQNRSNIVASINTSVGNSVSTAGGMDGEAPGVSGWLYIWLIDNGSSSSAVASLASGYGLAPHLPAGYNYSCRAGAVRVDSGGNLMRTVQRGQRAQYVVTTSTNTANMPAIASGSAGNPTTPTWVALATGNFVPPTAAEIDLVLWNVTTGISVVAPNNNYGAPNTAGNPPPMILSSAAAPGSPFAESKTMVLESTNIYWASNVTSGGIFCAGWTDGGVNAN